MSGVSVIIPAYGPGNGDDWQLIWLLDSLCEQTTRLDEVLICWDGPAAEGGILQTLSAWKHGGHPFDFRIFHRTAPKTVEHGGPGLAEQILFANVKGDVIIHMDADGYVDKHMVEFVIAQDPCKPMMRCLWGQNVFHNADTGAKLPHADPRLDRYPKTPGVYKMGHDPLDAHGALWACPAKVIHELGGHEMSGIDFRGNDSRLGQRIQAVMECDLVTDKRFQFHHFGLPTQYSLLHRLTVTKRSSSEDRFQAAQDVKRFKLSHRLPQLGWRDPLICNGGPAFWRSGILDGMYREIA